MNFRLRTNYIALLIVLLLFMALGLIRSKNAFDNEYMSLAYPGDGHGTIASFADYNRGIYEDGLWKLLGDRWSSGLGGGFHEPGPVSFF